MESNARVVPEFGEWADEIWNSAKSTYEFIGARDAATLNILYPSKSDRYKRLVVSARNRIIGWALMLDTKLKDHKQFANMRVGTIVDVLSLPGEEGAIIAQASLFLERQGVDLIVTNQSYTRWKVALKRCGFLVGPSNYGFAASPDLAREFSSLEQCHLTRGDGDGPINL
jgi:hypothetical protein